MGGADGTETDRPRWEALRDFAKLSSTPQSTESQGREAELDRALHAWAASMTFKATNFSQKGRFGPPLFSAQRHASSTAAKQRQKEAPYLDSQWGGIAIWWRWQG